MRAEVPELVVERGVESEGTSEHTSSSLLKLEVVVNRSTSGQQVGRTTDLPSSFLFSVVSTSGQAKMASATSSSFNKYF